MTRKHQRAASAALCYCFTRQRDRPRAGPFNRLRLVVAFQQLGVRRRQTSDRHPRRRARHVGQVGGLAEPHRARMTALLAADADLDARAALATVLDRERHQLANASGVQGFERVVL